MLADRGIEPCQPSDRIRSTKSIHIQDPPEYIANDSYPSRRQQRRYYAKMRSEEQLQPHDEHCHDRECAELDRVVYDLKEIEALW